LWDVRTARIIVSSVKGYYKPLALAMGYLTDPYPAYLGDYYYSIVDPAFPLGEVAAFWAGLLAMIIVLNREARTLIDHSGLWNRRK